MTASARRRSSDSALFRSRHLPTAASTRSKVLLAESAGTIGQVVDVCSPRWLYSALIFSYNQVLIKNCLEIPLTPAAKSSLVKRASGRTTLTRLVAGTSGLGIIFFSTI